MQKLVDLMRGNIRVEVECPYPERFLNLCARKGVDFSDLKRIGSRIRVTVHPRGYRNLRRAAEKAGISLRVVGERGAPFLARRLKKRYALLVSMAVCLGLVWISSLFVWEIRVAGNETVPTGEILAALDELGVHVGSFRLLIDQDYLSNEMLLKVPQLSWLTVNVSGSRATVLVREETPKPEMLDEDTPTVVYATKSGILSQLYVYQGASLVKAGDTVAQGDILITGAMSSKSSGTRLVHARGDVYARTWYTLSAQMPLETWEKSYTGESKEKYALVLGGKRINLYFSSGTDTGVYDKITDDTNWTVPGGTVLPVKVCTQELTAYELIPTLLDEEAAAKVLQQGLIRRLQERIGTGEILKQEFTVSRQSGVITVTLQAECREQIAKVRAMTPEEAAQAQQAEITDGEE